MSKESLSNKENWKKLYAAGIEITQADLKKNVRIYRAHRWMRGIKLVWIRTGENDASVLKRGEDYDVVYYRQRAHPYAVVLKTNPKKAIKNGIGAVFYSGRSG